jgi:hypothetical protein
MLSLSFFTFLLTLFCFDFLSLPFSLHFLSLFSFLTFLFTPFCFVLFLNLPLHAFLFWFYFFTFLFMLSSLLFFVNQSPNVFLPRFSFLTYLRFSACFSSFHFSFLVPFICSISSLFSFAPFLQCISLSFHLSCLICLLLLSINLLSSFLIHSVFLLG